jgi:hypothetical protein
VLEAVQKRLDGNPNAMRQWRETVEHPFATKYRTGRAMRRAVFHAKLERMVPRTCGSHRRGNMGAPLCERHSLSRTSSGSLKLTMARLSRFRVAERERQKFKAKLTEH